MAVGYSNSNLTVPYQQAAEEWNGTHWIDAPPVLTQNPAGLSSVDCVSSNWCMAVGFGGTDPFGTRVLSEIWNGVTWAVQSSPSADQVNNDLGAVSCTATTFCMALGSSGGGSTGGYGVVSQMWNGNTWSTVPVPGGYPISSGFIYSSLSCSSTLNCVAVGVNSVSGSQQAASMLWNGSDWSLMATPTPDNSSGLEGVSCTSDGTCVAVGASATGALIERWDGASWSIQPAPTVPGSSGNGLAAVECTSSNACVATGTEWIGNRRQTLVEELSGAIWTVTPSANRSGGDNYLGGVSCTSSGSCFVVGASYGTGNPATLVETASPMAPTITGPSSASFIVGWPGTFSVTDDGSPSPTLTELGSLPSGVTFTPAGVISGTPAPGTAGNYPIIITAANGVSPNATQSFMLTVQAAPQITSANATTFTVGSGGNFTVAATGYPAPTFSVASGTLPAGVTLNGTTGVLSGTPTTGSAVTYVVTISASNGVSPAASQSLTITVVTPPPTSLTVTTTSLPAGSLYSKTHRVSYTANLVASGGNLPYKWSLLPGSSLPPGLRLTAKGVIKGKAKTAGTYSFTVQVVDTKTKAKPPLRNTATATLSITIG